MTFFNKLFYLLSFTFALTSCIQSDIHREKDKIFHASSKYGGGIGGLYFGLYKDSTYQICNTGGVGQYCYSGEFKLNNDTLVLLNLNKDIPLKHNRFLIIRYNEHDSTYWKWKYTSTSISWLDLKQADTIIGSGDVYELDDNKLMNGKLDNHFIIRMDSLKIYH